MPKLNTQGSEYTKVLNMPDIVHNLGSLYKILTTYCDRGVFRRFSDSEDGALWKNNYTL